MFLEIYQDLLQLNDGQENTVMVDTEVSELNTEDAPKIVPNS
jgi:hypothetical protein